MRLPTDNQDIDRDVADFSFAFQPIVDVHTGDVHSHEALVRGLDNEPAYEVLARYAGSQSVGFDARCRSRAIEVASRIGLDTLLNINMSPSAAVDPDSGLRSTLDAAEKYSFPPDRLVVEVTEVDMIADIEGFAATINEFRRTGMQFAIDDFGSGYAGLALLSSFQPDVVKLDMSLVRGIESNGPRQAIVRAIQQVCIDLGIDILAEGVETLDEFAWFADLGVNLFQGYLFARPMFEAMPPYNLPETFGLWTNDRARNRLAIEG